MNAAKKVIEKFGGQSALATLIGKRQSTVQHWAKVGLIPAKWQPELLRLAQENGVDLYFGDFIGQPQAETVKVKKLSLPEARWWGTLVVGEWEIPCYVLEDARRVLGRAEVASVLTDEKEAAEKSGHLESLLEIKALKPYLPPKHAVKTVELTLPGAENKKVHGIEAETFVEICKAYVRARDEKALSAQRELKVAQNTAKILAACAREGLIALIDETTGYQYDRIQEALRQKLSFYIKDGLEKWEPTFPDQLWETFRRLTKWEGPLNSHPPYWGKLVMELVYEYLENDVVDWLRHNEPLPKDGKNQRQWLQNQYGLKELTEHIWMLVGMAKPCRTMLELRQKMAEQFGREAIYLTLFIKPPTELDGSPQSHARSARGKIRHLFVDAADHTQLK
ncbi:MAG TPA: P63C domain-containing protein [candidate division Zixibacteria bacterium]|nr:P63C domain-containing protein [candidate division Zixibacteria bacterium]